MTEAQKLLASMSTSYLVNPAKEPHIVIDTKRVIHVPKELQRIAVQFDHNIETVTFDCPRYWDGIDMSKMYIYVNFIRQDRIRGRYLCKNVQVDATNENIMHFTWTIEQDAALVKGKLRFLVCIMKTGEDGTLVNHWNSELNDECYISEGLECEDLPEEFYPEIITDLLTRMDNILSANTPILDLSLTESGLAADAKVVGDKFKSLETNTDAKINTNATRININSKILNKRRTPFNYPSGFNGTYKPVSIFWDGETFETDFDPDRFTHAGGKTYYISPDGTYLNDGLSRSAPVQLHQALDRCSNGDTIIVTAGDYFIMGGTGFDYVIDKSINIIGEDNPRMLFGGHDRIFTRDGETGLYKAEFNGWATHIFRRDNVDLCYKRVYSLDECANTENTYVSDSKHVYINSNRDISDEVYLMASAGDQNGLIIRNTSNCKVYIEGISLFGSNHVLTTDKSPSYDLEVICNRVNTYFNTSKQSAVCRFGGGNILLYACESMYGRGDGFSYSGYNHSDNAVETNFVEINCVGANNGLDEVMDLDNINGSTAHDGVKGIRVNGLYYNNMGANVADVHNGTQSLNLGCEVYDSPSVTASQGFGMQQSGTTAWLYNCKGYGNDADVVAYGGTTVYIHDCDFVYIAGGGTIKEIEM